jgi:hypothetical protein
MQNQMQPQMPRPMPQQGGGQAFGYGKRDPYAAAPQDPMQEAIQTQGKQWIRG